MSFIYTRSSDPNCNVYRCDEDESDAGVVVPPDDAAVGVGDVGGEEGDVVRLPEERHAVEGGQQRERNLNLKYLNDFILPYVYVLADGGAWHEQHEFPIYDLTI